MAPATCTSSPCPSPLPRTSARIAATAATVPATAATVPATAATVPATSTCGNDDCFGNRNVTTAASTALPRRLARSGEGARGHSGWLPTNFDAPALGGTTLEIANVQPVQQAYSAQHGGSSEWHNSPGKFKYLLVGGHPRRGPWLILDCARTARSLSEITD